MEEMRLHSKKIFFKEVLTFDQKMRSLELHMKKNSQRKNMK